MAYDGMYGDLSTRAAANEVLNLAIVTKEQIEELAAEVDADRVSIEVTAAQVHADAELVANASTELAAEVAETVATTTATTVATTVATDIATDVSTDAVNTSQSFIFSELASAIGATLVGYRGGDILTANAALRTIQIKHDETRSLADFVGFVGNGTNDDTAAVAAAVAWQKSKAQTFNPIIGGSGASAAVVCPGLTVPKGARVKMTSTVDAPLSIVADGFASFEAASDVDMFFNNGIYRSHWENLYFIGGHTNIKLQNQNINFGLWSFVRCTWIGSNDYSVMLLNTSVTYGVTSTQAIFDNCRWTRCRRSIKTQCDHTFIEGGWMQPEADWFDTNTAVVQNTGLLTVQNMMLIPAGTFPAKCRWFDIDGGARFDKVRFGGEGGGLPGVYWTGAPPRFTVGTDNTIEGGVTFENCTIYFGSGARPDSGGVVLQGQLPRSVRFTNCIGPIAGMYIRNDPANGGIPDIAAYLAALKTAWSGDDISMDFTFHYTGTNGKVNARMWPAALDIYTYTNKGRFVDPKVILTAPGTSIPTGTLTRVSFDTATYDPYTMVWVSGGATVVRSLPKSRTARVTANLEASSVVADNLRYTARVYVSGSPTNIYAEYVHNTAGLRHLHLAGLVTVGNNQEIDIRVTQNTGAAVVFSGTLAVDLELSDYV